MNMESVELASRKLEIAADLDRLQDVRTDIEETNAAWTKEIQTVYTEDQRATFAAMKDLITAAHAEAKRLEEALDNEYEETLSDEQKHRMEDIDKHYHPAIEALKSSEVRLETRIKNGIDGTPEVYRETVKGNHLMAVPRVTETWDKKMLAGYMLAQPSVGGCLKITHSVQIRKN